MNTLWTTQEKDFIRKNAGNLTDAQIAKELTQSSGREVSIHAARKQRQNLGLRKCPGRGVCQLFIETKDKR